MLWEGDVVGNEEQAGLLPKVKEGGCIVAGGGEGVA